MKIDSTTDKRILERELHLQGRVLKKDIDRLAEELPDLASRIDSDSGDPERVRERLLAEAKVRNERIRRSLADTEKQSAYRSERSDLEG